MTATSYLAAGQYLTSNQFLVSPSGLFYAVMQADGNFCVYRGPGPNDNLGCLWAARQEALSQDDFFVVMQADGNLCVYRGTGPNDQQECLWASERVALALGDYFVALQDDGNLCVYKGTGPSDNEGLVWASGVTDPVKTVDPITSITYDVDAAQIVGSPTSRELYRQTVANQSDVTQTTSIQSSTSVSETSGWSDTLGVKIGVSTSFQAGIPFIADGKITVSTEVTNSYTWNGSTTTTRVWSFNAPVTVPPHDTITALVTVQISTLVVPYTLEGIVELTSGVKLPGTIHGVYTGTNSHDMTVTFVSSNPDVETRTEPVQDATVRLAEADPVPA
jgi:hypothetical protein